MATTTAVLVHSSKPIFSPKQNRAPFLCHSPQQQKPIRNTIIRDPKKAVAGLIGTGLALTLVGPSSAAELSSAVSSLQLSEPANALSLPTWAIHVSSVVEWIIAMALVWKYGRNPGSNHGRVCLGVWYPCLRSICACTWHFFYNSESLEVLVALQAALTVIGNATMCYAAFRIFKLSQQQSQNM